MRKTLTSLLFAGIAATFAVAGPAHANHGEGPRAAMEHANQTMMDAMMGHPLSGDPDQDFAMMMIPHHEGAIEMARVELQYGKDPLLRKMAEEIIKAQEAEIETLRKWQAEHAN
jgi:uncharacterized protein (DUF305 family)